MEVKYELCWNQKPILKKLNLQADDLRLVTVWRRTGLPRWLSGKGSTCQCRRCRFSPWVRKIPRRKEWWSTPGFLPGESHGQSYGQTPVSTCAKSLLSSLTLLRPHGCSPPGSSVRGILQARILEWLPCPPPGDLSDPGIKQASLNLQHWRVGSLPLEHLGSPDYAIEASSWVWDFPKRKKNNG